MSLDNVDPFKWPAPWRDLAMAGTGAGFDDSAAFPTIRRAMVPRHLGYEISTQFLTWRKTSMSLVGKWLCPDATPDVQYARMKGITNAFDMDSRLNAWHSQKWAAGDTRSLAACTVTLPDGSTFCFANYRNAQGSSTKWMAERSASMIECIRSRLHPSSDKWRKAPLTAKSYILQEAEATARCAKIAELRSEGIPIFNLQHDGIIAGVPKDSVAAWATRLAAAASLRCHLPVTVKGDWLQ